MITVMGQKHHGVSWSKVGRAIVKWLNRFNVDAVYVDFNRALPDITETIILVPVEWTIGQTPSVARYVFKKARSLAGFLSCDSTEPGKVAVYLANMLDVAILTGNFATDIWGNHLQGVYTSVVHLGIDPEIYTKPYNPKPIEPVRKVRELEGIKVFMVVTHDVFRKNMDIALRALEEIKRKHGDDVQIVLKVSRFTRDVIPVFLQQEAVIIEGTLSEEDMVDLYDSVDIVLVPSGAGSCELIAVEALARGRIVITSSWYAFREYVPQAIHIACDRWERPPPDPIADAMSCGTVCRINKEMLINVLDSLIENIDDAREVFKNLSRPVIERWRWDRIVKEELIPLIESRNLDM